MPKKGKTAKKPAAPPKRSTEKQRLFAVAWIETRGNATESARRAGYRGNDVTLAAVGYKLLKNAQVQALINELTDQNPRSTKRRVIKARRVMELYTMIAEGDPSLKTDELVFRVGGGAEPDPRKLTPEVLKHMSENQGMPPEGVDIYYHPPVSVAERSSALRDVAKILRMTEDQTAPVAVFVLRSVLPSLGLPDDVTRQVQEALVGAIDRLKVPA